MVPDTFSVSDVDAQRRIAGARQELCDNFEEALPSLIEALDDNRYCMTISWAQGDAYYNYSVGKICRNIIESNLEVYRSAMRFSGPQHWHRYDYDAVSKEWWQAQKERGLRGLQVKAINWAIERRKAEGEVGERRKNEVGDLEKLRDGIINSGKPEKPRQMLRMVTSDK